MLTHHIICFLQKEFKQILVYLLQVFQTTAYFPFFEFLILEKILNIVTLKFHPCVNLQTKPVKSLNKQNGILTPLEAMSVSAF